MQALPKLMETLVKEIKDNSNVVVISGLVFTYQAIKDEFPCTCEPQEKLCYGYMIFPVLIVVALMLLTDARFRRALRYSCMISSCDLCWVLTRGLLKALCVGGLWVAAVLINADWYVCCNNQNDRTVAATQCKENKDITPGGEPVVTILEMKDDSMFYGLLLVLLLTVFGFMLPFWRTCCPKSCLGRKGCSREVDMYELILEVGEDVVAETQKRIQGEKFSLKMEEASGKWVDFLEVAEEFIDPWRQEGAKGQVGPQGPDGQVGPQGPEGQGGPQGPDGQVGPQGPEGQVGPQGPDGQGGPQGPDGQVGPQGPEGQVGPQGPDGQGGPQGPEGQEEKEGQGGPQGPDGQEGQQGPDGQGGPQGPEGQGGPQGPEGQEEKEGQGGPQGPQGPEGQGGLGRQEGQEGQGGPQEPEGQGGLGREEGQEGQGGRGRTAGTGGTGRIDETGGAGGPEGKEEQQGQGGQGGQEGLEMKNLRQSK